MAGNVCAVNFSTVFVRALFASEACATLGLLRRRRRRRTPRRHAAAHAACCTPTLLFYTSQSTPCRAHLRAACSCCSSGAPYFCGARLRGRRATLRDSQLLAPRRLARTMAAPGAADAVDRDVVLSWTNKIPWDTYIGCVRCRIAYRACARRADSRREERRCAPPSTPHISLRRCPARALLPARQRRPVRVVGRGRFLVGGRRARHPALCQRRLGRGLGHVGAAGHARRGARRAGARAAPRASAAPRAMSARAGPFVTPRPPRRTRCATRRRC